ncbi:MAG: hypothetical protein K2J46_07885 [Muribaculaceae bacterium]|nr:hypothetical protein [Muribaculaceae bacterium]
MLSFVLQKGSGVYAYNSNGGVLWSKTGTLLGYTSDTVTMQIGNTTYVFGERGQILHMK